MYYIGLISGTSMDAVDCALLKVSADDIELTAYQQYPVDTGIRKDLLSINSSTPIGTVSHLDARLGRLFAEAALSVLRDSGIDHSQVKAIGSHGQTVLHQPEPPDASSLQIGDANSIASITGITTVADFRRMDMAAGGEGAPLAPIMHEALFRRHDRDVVVVNIGGMANITILPAMGNKQPVTGFDTGPGNVLMDEWIRLHQQQPYDANGAWAASGHVNEELQRQMLEFRYFADPPPKSTGRDDFNLDWLQGQLDTFRENLAAEDIQATLLALTATSIANAVNEYAVNATEMIVCGGGAHNSALMQALQAKLPDLDVCSSGERGYNPDAIEAMAFAWLAHCRLVGKSGNIASVTGASGPRLLGAIYQATGD